MNELDRLIKENADLKAEIKRLKNRGAGRPHRNPGRHAGIHPAADPSGITRKEMYRKSRQRGCLLFSGMAREEKTIQIPEKVV